MQETAKNEQMFLRMKELQEEFEFLDLQENFIK